MKRVFQFEAQLEHMTEVERIDWYKAKVEERFDTLGITPDDLTNQEREELKEEFEAVKDGNVFLHQVLYRPEIIYRARKGERNNQ